MNQRICAICGKIDLLVGEVRSENCHSCAIRKARTGKRRIFDRGNTNGYRMIYVDGKRFYEHRYVMEQYLGRKLNRNEHVHHIDGNTINNVIENLELITASEHGRMHMTTEVAKQRSALAHKARRQKSEAI